MPPLSLYPIAETVCRLDVIQSAYQNIDEVVAHVKELVERSKYLIATLNGV